MNRKKKINRQSNFDLLRIISTISVVLIHEDSISLLASAQ